MSLNTLKYVLGGYGSIVMGSFVKNLYNDVQERKNLSREVNDSTFNLVTTSLKDNWKENAQKSLLWVYYQTGLDKVDIKKMDLFKKTVDNDDEAVTDMYVEKKDKSNDNNNERRQ